MSKGRKKIDGNSSQTALFDVPILDFTVFKQAIKESLKQCSLSRDQVADRMSMLLGKRISVDEINTWTAASKPGHLPRADEVMALTVACMRPEALSALAAPAEFDVIGKEDAELLHLAKLKLRKKALEQEIEMIESTRIRIQDSGTRGGRNG